MGISSTSAQVSALEVEAEEFEAEEFEAGGEELPTEKVGNSPSLNFALAGLPAVTTRHCYLIFSKLLQLDTNHYVQRT